MAFSVQPAIPSPPPVHRQSSPCQWRSGVVVGGKTSQVQANNINAQQSLVIHETSRREAIVCLTAASLVIPFISTDLAEARTSRQENKRKIREKVDKLREKAAAPQPKTKSSKGDEEKPVIPFNALTPSVVEANLL